MIDIENYERTIAWPRRGLNEFMQEPDDRALRLDLLHRFGLLLDLAKEAWLGTATVNLETILPELPSYANRLDAFAQSLKQKVARLA